MEDRELTKLFVLVSAVVLALAAGWVWSVYYFGNANLEKLTQERSEQLRRSYEANIRQHSQFMLEIANYVASDPTVQQLFHDGSQAVAKGDNASAARARSDLLDHVQHSWRDRGATLSDRVMHFHLPPATSFLRVHAPDRFGDDLSKLRSSVVEAIQRQSVVTGLETGRYFSGLRAVTPVVKPDDDGSRQFIGVLEVGLPLSVVLRDLNEQVQADFAILFGVEHLSERMPAAVLTDYLASHSVFDGYALEWSSDTDPDHRVIAAELMRNPPKHETTALESHRLSDWRESFGIATFPLREAVDASQDRRDQPLGVVFSWFSLEPEVRALHERVVRSLLIALFVVLAIEVMLYLALMRERDLRRERHASLTDALTGIGNRRHFEETLDQEVRRATRSRTPISVILCDIDLFKPYNDFYGHPAGDECIRQVATAMKQSLRRAGDFVARYGGEEFIAILPDTDLEAARRVAERLRASVQALGVTHERHPLGVVTISLGVTSGTVESNSASEVLIATADAALYQAKEHGRNQVCAEPYPSATSVDKHALPVMYR